MKSGIYGALDLLGVNALFRRRNRGRIKVLLYHNVTIGGHSFDYAISPEDFEAQVEHLKRHYNLVGLDQSGCWQGYRRDRVNVLITFDDGFINNADIAAPILADKGVPAVFFVIANCLETGAEPQFAQKYSDMSGSRAAYRTLDIAGAKGLIEMGMTIGSHSLDHRDFSSFSNDEVDADATASRARLEAALGCEVALFAFPWGKHGPGQENRLARRYERVFLTKHGFADPDDRVLPRNEVANNLHLRAAASGALDFMKGVATRAFWLPRLRMNQATRQI